MLVKYKSNPIDILGCTTAAWYNNAWCNTQFKFATQDMSFRQTKNRCGQLKALQRKLTINVQTVQYTINASGNSSRQEDECLACEMRAGLFIWIYHHPRSRELAQIGKLRLPVRVALQNAHTRVGRLTSNVRLITHVSQCQTIIYHGIRSPLQRPFQDFISDGGAAAF